MENVVPALSGDGIYALEQLPAADCPVVLLAHGINADHTEDRSAGKPGMFDLVVEKLSALGIGTLRFDFRGHGRSAEVPGFVSIRSEVSDLDVVLQYITDTHGRMDGLVACSFGACATSAVADERKLGAIALINPVLRPLETFIDPGSSWARQSFTPAAMAELEHSGKLLLDDTFPLGRDFVEDVRISNPAESFRVYDGPMFVAHGTIDSYVPFEYSRDFAASRVCSFLSVNGSEHGFGRIEDREFVADATTSFISWSLSLSG
jgi:pimeloyl-ACP methyl ester carboxylesterase